MLKIEKIKEKILNFNHANDALRCYLARVTTKQSNIDGCCRPNLCCEECLKVSFIDLLEEYKESVKLTKFEYEYLKVAKKEGFNFIARDKSNILYGFEKQPTKDNATWGSRGYYVSMFKSTFKFFKWEDEEPWNIDNILANEEIFEAELSAKEMFEELGWKKMYESQCSIIYEKGFRTISFLHQSNNVNVVDSSGHIDMKLLKAINKQCKELGWI